MIQGIQPQVPFTANNSVRFGFLREVPSKYRAMLGDVINFSGDNDDHTQFGCGQQLNTLA